MFCKVKILLGLPTNSQHSSNLININNPTNKCNKLSLERHMVNHNNLNKMILQTNNPKDKFRNNKVVELDLKRN